MPIKMAGSWTYFGTSAAAIRRVVVRSLVHVVLLGPSLSASSVCRAMVVSLMLDSDVDLERSSFAEDPAAAEISDGLEQRDRLKADMDSSNVTFEEPTLLDVRRRDVSSSWSQYHELLTRAGADPFPDDLVVLQNDSDCFNGKDSRFTAEGYPFAGTTKEMREGDMGWVTRAESRGWRKLTRHISYLNRAYFAVFHLSANLTVSPFGTMSDAALTDVARSAIAEALLVPRPDVVIIRIQVVPAGGAPVVSSSSSTSFLDTARAWLAGAAQDDPGSVLEFEAEIYPVTQYEHMLDGRTALQDLQERAKHPSAWGDLLLQMEKRGVPATGFVEKPAVHCAVRWNEDATATTTADTSTTTTSTTTTLVKLVLDLDAPSRQDLESAGFKFHGLNLDSGVARPLPDTLFDETKSGISLVKSGTRRLDKYVFRKCCQSSLDQYNGNECNNAESDGYLGYGSGYGLMAVGVKQGDHLRMGPHLSYALPGSKGKITLKLRSCFGTSLTSNNWPGAVAVYIGNAPDDAWYTGKELRLSDVNARRCLGACSESNTLEYNTWYHAARSAGDTQCTVQCTDQSRCIKEAEKSTDQEVKESCLWMGTGETKSEDAATEPLPDWQTRVYEYDAANQTLYIATKGWAAIQVGSIAITQEAEV